MRMRHIAILGSTGSIGRSSLDVIASFPERFSVSYLAANRNVALLKEQIERFHPRAVAVRDERCASSLRSSLDGSTEVLSGDAALLEIVRRPGIDLVISALVGIAGLKPTLEAIEAGKDIALANKESLVVAGEILTRRARELGVRILPVDSEHSAILQCLQGENPGEVKRLILTASGGPFLDMERRLFESVTVAQALNHPTWKMGSKITIDSATLMNKGLEVIEAFWLFGIPAESIDVVIHPQSIVHSMVEFADGSIKAQMGVPDMKLPIQYALVYPERPPSAYDRVDFSVTRTMTFLPPDTEKFRCLPLAYRALSMGGSAPAVMNAANEVAVQLFLEGRILFSDIPSMIEESLSRHRPIRQATLDDVMAADRQTRADLHRQLSTVE